MKNELELLTIVIQIDEKYLIDLVLLFIWNRFKKMENLSRKNFHHVQFSQQRHHQYRFKNITRKLHYKSKFKSFFSRFEFFFLIKFLLFIRQTLAEAVRNRALRRSLTEYSQFDWNKIPTGAEKRLMDAENQVTQPDVISIFFQ